MNRGGAEAMIMNLYRTIDRSKVQFDFMVHTRETCDFDDEIRALGGRIYHVPSYTVINHFRYKKEWNQFFAKHPEYKIIHGHLYSTAAIYLKIAKRHGIVAIAHSHNTSYDPGVKALLKKVLQYPIRYIADYYFACSEAAGKWLFGDTIIASERFQILRNAIETQRYIYDEVIRDELREEFQFNEKFVIGHIGRFDPQKNHTFLIDVFQKVHKENPDTILLLIGTGKLRKKIEDKVRRLGLTDSVIFAGVRSDVNKLYQAMDIFLFPSNYEGLGVVVIEAQAAGLPCIVADTIPKEAFISDNIRALSLQDDLEVWKHYVLDYSNHIERKNQYKTIVESGYDVKSTSRFLEEFYGGMQK
jgi:glycosyltransferase involved in cell wall biosynthesis